MKKLILYILLVFFIASCKPVDYYPQTIIKYRGKCLQMRYKPLFNERIVRRTASEYHTRRSYSSPKKKFKKKQRYSKYTKFSSRRR